MNQDPLRSYVKRVAKNDEDLGQLSEVALQSLRTVTEHFIDEIGALAAAHMAKHEGTPLTSDILKSLVHASKSQTFDPVRHVLDTLTIPPHREKPVKKRVKASSPRRAKKVVKRTTEPKKAASVVQPAPSVDLIEEDDDYDASD
ncbi:hypothetical protein AaE_010094 [Aphanomyces astaci]|uniref:Transcription factor CBF/NF-Y/archaeal histone domain-containing protein n=1 Tax=Aphanomyces astaci TaxID=112090 RepID=A0A6A5A8N6_APHAT|nr:hypothetical protein AaE_010094 [Aphanomyces astaci]